MVNMDAVWDRTMEFVSDNLGAVLAIVIPFIFLPAAISGVVEGPAATGEATTRLVLQAIVLVLALVSIFGQVALTALAIAPDAGAAAARARGLRRLLPVIGVTLVFALAAFVLFVPVFLILLAYGFDFVAASMGTQPQVPPVAAAWVGLYVIVLLPVMLFLVARLMLIMPALVDAPIGLGAIGRSWSLTRGLTLKLVGVIILYAIVAAFLTLGVGAGVGAVLVLIAGGEGPVTVAGVLTALILALVTTVLTIIQTVFVARLYVAVAARRPPIAEDPVAEPLG